MVELEAHHESNLFMYRVRWPTLLLVPQCDEERCNVKSGQTSCTWSDFTRDMFLRFPDGCSLRPGEI